MNISIGSFLAGLVFSGVGFVALRYGRGTGNTRKMVIGGALMAYPYFVPDLLWTCIVGAALTGLLFYGNE